MARLHSVTDSPDEPHDERTAARNAKLGLILFFIYLVLYGGFVLINAFSPDTMDVRPVAGINLAVLYGFGLIIAAFVLALLYGFMCRNDVSGPTTSDGSEPTSTSTQEESP